MNRGERRFRCIRHKELELGGIFYVFRSDEREPRCPKCGLAGSPFVFPLVDIHYVVVGTGPIYGLYGHQHAACQPRRDAFCRNPLDVFPASDDPRVVTCMSCRTTRAWKNAAKQMAAIDDEWYVRMAKQEIDEALAKR